MKVLRITAQGLPLFKEELDISFFAQQRVADDDKDLLYPLFANVYMNCSNAFIGINAAGKTSVLKVILLALNLLNNQPINHIETKEILGDTDRAVINIYFHSETGEVCRLETVITSEKTKADTSYYRIVKEALWVKPQDSVTARKNLTDFSACEPFAVRKEEEFLSDDVSIIIAYNKKKREQMDIVSLLSFTNINVLPFADEIPAEVIYFLDPAIEKLYFDKMEKKTLIHLQFKGRQEITLNNPMDLNLYLSSGTIKGIVAFTLAKEVLKSGGYLVMDEIENHFNKEIVSTLIRFFMDARLNKNGGTLIFTTHYPELLDEYDRNDSIHIIRNKDGIAVENLANILKRNDIKKSEAYQSGFLEGTTPMYESYMRLKKSIADSV
ncbi:MAG: ATP-binding protein [Eubacteriales bacterium]|nr:ATP-binding protein [Eubacteriales bacterium]